MDGMGWIPVDVTPGFYYDTYALLQMAQVPGDIQRTAALEDSGEEVDAPDSLHAGKRPDSEVIDQLKASCWSFSFSRESASSSWNSAI